MARLFVALVALGYGHGLASLGWIRSEPLFDSFHALLATGALIGLVAAWWIGRGMAEVDEPDPQDRIAHLACAGAGLLLALASGAAGIAILP
jgi:hypothetical protein